MLNWIAAIFFSGTYLVIKTYILVVCHSLHIQRYCRGNHGSFLLFDGKLDYWIIRFYLLQKFSLVVVLQNFVVGLKYLIEKTCRKQDHEPVQKVAIISFKGDY